MDVIGVWRDGQADGAGVVAGLAAAGIDARTVTAVAQLPGECLGLVADMAVLVRQEAAVAAVRAAASPAGFPVVALLPAAAGDAEVTRALALADEVAREPVCGAELAGRLHLLLALRRCRITTSQARSDLSWKVKALGCLADVHAVIQRFDQPREALFAGIVALLPPAMLHPELAGARILVDGREYASPGFVPGPHRLSFSLARSGQPDAALEVHYAGEVALDGVSAFSSEENELVRLVAERLERTLARLRSDAALRREQEYSTLLMDTLPGGVVRFDRSGTLFFSNPRAKAVLELPERGLGDVSYNDPGFDTQTVEGVPLAPGEHPFEKVLATGSPVYDMMLSLRQPDGGRRFVSVSAAPLFGLDGAIDEVVASVVDVTAQKAMERQLAHVLKMESLGQLAAGLAHEINTPVQYVVGNLEFLANAFTRLVELLDTLGALVLDARTGEEGDLRTALATMLADEDLRYFLEETPAALRESREGLDRVASIVGSMKRFAHPDIEGVLPVDVGEAVADALAVSRSAWRYVATVETDIEPDLPPVAFAPGDFNQVLLNIIVNAAQAIEEHLAGTADQGRIAIQAARHGGTVVLTIADTGGGIPASVRARIFDPFFTTKPVGKGTGQGLAIVHAIMARHKAGIDCISRPGEGTTFVLTLPLAGPMAIDA